MHPINLQPSDREVKKFGFYATAGFTAAGIALAIWPIKVLPVAAFWWIAGLGWFLCLASLLGLVGVVRPFYLAMTLLGWPIGFVVSHVLLAAIYFLMFTPVGLVFRLTGRDTMRRRQHRRVDSYWIKRDKQRTPASYLRLY